MMMPIFEGNFKCVRFMLVVTTIMWSAFILFKSVEFLLYASLILTGATLAVCILSKEMKAKDNYLKAVLKIVDDLIDEQYANRYRGHYDRESDVIGRKIKYLAEKLEEKTTLVNQQHMHLNSLMQHLPLGIMVLNQHKKVVLANQALQNFLGDIYQVLFLDYFKLDMIRSSSLIQLIDKAFVTTSPQQSQVYMYESSEMSVDAHVIPILDSYQNIEEVLVLLYDLTDYRRLQIAQSDFVSNASHELKTPVSIIKGFVETLMDGAKDDPETRDYFLNIIFQETEKLEQLMKDILLLSKLEKKAMIMTKEAVYLHAVIEDSVVLVEENASQHNITLDVEPFDKSLWLIGDKNHLMQIISNLLSNAVRYTKPNGYVRIRVTETEHHISIAIKDTGIGIAPKDKERIFERFYRGENAQKFNENGTGLGLSIVKNLVDIIGATIQVDSQLGFGTTMTVILEK